ncbi:Hypoxia up-regulated protein 1 [Gonapodya sp. JEL0774]|nr:Hypoxia up-regulated protein 1 [Gonapodya sp. JEL0774]
MANPHAYSSMILCALLLFLFSLPSFDHHSSVHAAGVLGIDYGAEWFKSALLKPGQGVKFDVVLNSESKRKTKSLVVIKGRERLFGTEAINLAVRLPHDAYPAVKPLLGRTFDDPISSEYRETFDNTMVIDGLRGTVAFQHEEIDAEGNVQSVLYTAEEIVAMQLKHARDQAEAAAGEVVKDCVLTVPRFFNQYERQALLDAAELAGLNVLGLIHDDVAVAINFAMNRHRDLADDSKPTYHIFYDAGASSTVASLVSFQKSPTNAKTKSSASPSQEIVVESVGFDRTLGGHAFDLRVQKYLAEQFDKKHGNTKKVYKNHRAMMKLLREAQKVKEVLSANSETFASIENVMDDLDFRLRITRGDFESLTADLIERAAGPIEDVLRKANLGPGDIGSVILHGGCTRVPAVQSALKALVGEDKLAKNVNSDEAAVMGAVYHGATLSRSFRVVNKMRVRDVASYPVVAVYDSEPLEDGSTKNYRVKLFSNNGTLNSQKLMNFKRTSDFEWSLEYGYTDEEAITIGPRKIVTLTTHNLTASIDAVQANESLAIVGEPKLKALVHLTDLGTVEVKDISLYVDVELTKEKKSFADRVLSFFGKKDGNSTEEDETLSAPTTEEGANADNATETTVAEANKTSAKPELRTDTLAINFTIDARGVEPMSVEAKVASLKRFDALDAEDIRRRQREEARNGLEAYIYSSRDLLEREDVIEVTTSEERAALQAKISVTSEWMYTEGDDAVYSMLKEQIYGLEQLRKPLELKRDEKQRRPSAITTLRTAIDGAKKWADTVKAVVASSRARWEEEQKKKEEKVKSETSAKASIATTEEALTESGEDTELDGDIDGGYGQDSSTARASTVTKSPINTNATPTIDVFRPLYTDEEISDVLKLVASAESWLIKREAEQAKLPKHAKPVLTVRELEDRASELENAILKMGKRKKPPFTKAWSTSASDTKKTPTPSAKTSDGKPVRTPKPTKESREREEL